MKLTVPNEIRYGLNARHDTFTKKLGFMIYANKPNGTYGQQTSFDGWRDKSFEPKDIPNEYQTGFVLNKGRLNKYHFGASAKFRVFHPEGFEFEISLENLTMILDHCVISYGEINLPCCIAWEGSNVYLLPQINLGESVQVEYFDVHEKKKKAKIRLEKINNSGKPLSPRTLTNDKIVEDSDGNRYYVYAPRQNTTKNILNAFFVEEKNGLFLLKNNYGNEYGTKFDPVIDKMFFPLNKTNEVISNDIEKKMIKFVEEQDLSKFEKENLAIIKKNPVIQFNEKQNFVPLNNNPTEIKAFFDKIKNFYTKEKIFSNRQGKGNVLILDEVVSVDGVLHYIVLGDTRRLGYRNNCHKLNELINKARKDLQLNTFQYASFNDEGMYFVPFTKKGNTYSQKEDGYYKGFSIINMNEQNLSERNKLLLQNLKETEVEIFSELIGTITQEEINKQSRIILKRD